MSSQEHSYFQSVRSKVHGEADLGSGGERNGKTQDELFREHQEAARRWTQEQRRGEPAADDYSVPKRESSTGQISGQSQNGSLQSMSEFDVAPVISSSKGPFSPPAHRVSSPVIRMETNFKRGSEGKPPLAPTSRFVSPPRRSDVQAGRSSEEEKAIVPTTLKGRIQSAVGIDALTKTEQFMLLAILIATAIVLLVLEYTVPARSQQLLLLAQYRTMTRFDVALSVTLGVLLSLTFDADTANTDRILAEWYHAAQEKIHAALGTQRDGTQAALTWRQAAVSPFSRLALVALALGYLLKVAAGAAVDVVVSVSARYGRLALLLCAGAVVLYLAYRVTAWYLRRSRARAEVVAVVAAKAKALLAAKGRAYPISYLYEEVGDSIKLAQSGLGDINPADSVLSPLPAKHRSLAALLFGGVSYLGGATPATATALPAYPEATVVGSAGPSSGSVVDPSGAHARDILKGHSLRRLWGEVQRAVQKDSRLQRLELIVDGKRQPCWRILAGNTGAGI